MEDPKTTEDTEITVSHIISESCQCNVCNKYRKRNFLIEDIDKLINSLNDWD